VVGPGPPSPVSVSDRAQGQVVWFYFGSSADADMIYREVWLGTGPHVPEPQA